MPAPQKAVSDNPGVGQLSAGVCHYTPFAGSWFPGEQRELAAMLDSLWEKSERRTGSFLLPHPAGFIVPHAGLMYSGVVAASAYRHIERASPGRAVLLGFSHRGGPNGICLPDIDSFQTPLGAVRLDRAFGARLLKHPSFKLVPEERVCDHSVEIQLPLLQKATPGILVVPLYVGHLTAEERADAAGWLKECLDPGDVILASSDLTHFGGAFGFRPFGVDSRTAESLRKLDHEVMDATGSLLEDLFLDTLRRTSATVCGYEPISLLLAVLRQLDRQEELYQDVLDYQTSGEITGDFHHSVSYGATGYFPWHAFELTGEEKTELLDVARRTLDTYQRTGKRERPAGAPKLPGLERRSSVFVTLHRGGELRGCLGRSSGDERLWESVPDLTIAAATEDRRFPPLARGETGVEIEISVLSPMKRILDQSGFRVNIHGALLEAGSRHGLLLPQVATERNWGAEPFFDALARKAGVSRAACSDESTRLRVFRAQVIH